MGDGKLPLILIVEDEPLVAELLKELLVHRFRVACADRIVDALDIADRDAPDLVLLDLQLLDGSGQTFAHDYRAAGGRAPIVVVSGRPGSREIALHIRAAAFLPKPLELGMVERVVETQLGLLPAA